jgi:phenol 2-monooxygenase (NADPH)
MPVFTEFATAYRDLRILPSCAQPLPRLEPTGGLGTENFEVVVIGVSHHLCLAHSMRRYWDF